MADTLPAAIYVLAGTNGAGKSSIGGATLAMAGVPYFNPNETAKRFQALNPGLSAEEANSAAWQQGKRLLEEAIRRRGRFAFETTLGGRSITALLENALAEKIEVHLFYVGLATAELHLARVRARVARGGHDIPEAKIRERFHQSRLNLIRLMPRLTESLVFDNSFEADPYTGAAPRPLLVLHMISGQTKQSCPPDSVPQWAKPIVMAAMRLGRR